jgi:restriction endonuclease S subunit
MFIKDIAEVQAGFAFREAIVPNREGNICVFQAKDLVQGVPFTNTASLIKVSLELPEYVGHLRKNDVLLVARGMKAGTFRSTVFNTDEVNVIASSSVHIIRITANDVIPEYVSHYLNCKDGQNAISEILSGAHIGVIPRKELENMKIPIPVIGKQKSIVNLMNNMREQQRIVEKRNALKQEIIDGTFRNLTTK